MCARKEAIGTMTEKKSADGLGTGQLIFFCTPVHDYGLLKIHQVVRDFITLLAKVYHDSARGVKITHSKGVRYLGFLGRFRDFFGIFLDFSVKVCAILQF